jgi:hypothetical protein
MVPPNILPTKMLWPVHSRVCHTIARSATGTLSLAQWRPFRLSKWVRLAKVERASGGLETGFLGKIL